MLNVIDFLEKVGRDGRLRHASPADIRLNLIGEGLEPELEQALLAGDQEQLAALLGKGTLCAMLFPAKEDEDESQEEDPSRKDDEEVTLVSPIQTLASVA